MRGNIPHSSDREKYYRLADCLRELNTYAQSAGGRLLAENIHLICNYKRYRKKGAVCFH